MEDMARLALVEQYVKDTKKFHAILQELWQFFNEILDKPHDFDVRLIRSPLLKNTLTCEPFKDYLNHLGFVPILDELMYPKEKTVCRLNIALEVVERKINLCCLPVRPNLSLDFIRTQNTKPQLEPSFIKLVKLNPFLIHIRTLFNDMLKYEDENLLRNARAQIPMETLRIKAIERMRERQKKIKTGEIKGTDLSFDMALLMELMGWFKYKFFTWVDKPLCEDCGGTTIFVTSTHMHGEYESCNLEIYKCTRCAKGARFPRYNEPANVLRTRRGRCGEWAIGFTLLCRSLGYDTRYVYDTTDHVWCEVFDNDSNSWIHVDPCEGAINTPLMYCNGWGKKISYVFAYSKDDLQDVTWRYTMNHKEVLARRDEVSEKDLLDTILALREHRLAQMSPARRNYLLLRDLRELVDLLFERKPTDYECRGRISGSLQWRLWRGEIEAHREGHEFEFSSYGNHTVRYYTAQDKYRIYSNGREDPVVDEWNNGFFECQHIFRKVEKDWRQTYLAREEGEETGLISWRFLAGGKDLIYKSISIRLLSAVYENGRIEWTIKFDDEAPISVELGETEKLHARDFSSVIVRAHLSGGRGDVAWQHAQLFRQSLDDIKPALQFVLHMAHK